MSIALATTTITVSRASEPEPGEGRTLSPLKPFVRATITGEHGVEDTSPGGGQQTIEARLNCDIVFGFDHICVVHDDQTNLDWEVVWVLERNGLGLDHCDGVLRRFSGGGR